MGIRTTQVYGLSEAGRRLVEGERILLCTERGERQYPDGHTEPFEREVHGPSVTTEETGRTFSGMFGEEFPLHRYLLPNGRVLEEHVQAEPWSSGPCIFLALKEGRRWVRESLWSDEDVAGA
jgi:hypothetical protein